MTMPELVHVHVNQNETVYVKNGKLHLIDTDTFKKMNYEYKLMHETEFTFNYFGCKYTTCLANKDAIFKRLDALKNIDTKINIKMKYIEAVKKVREAVENYEL